MECPSCGSRVSRGAATCAVCGEGLQAGLTAIIPRKAVSTLQIERGYATAAAAAPVVVSDLAFDEDFDEVSTVARERETIVLVPVLAPEPSPSGSLSGRHCIVCAEELEQDAHFCSQCGTTVAAASASSTPLESTSAPLVEPETAPEAETPRPVRNTLHLVSAPPDTVAADPAELLPPPSTGTSLSTFLSTVDVSTVALVCACAALVAAAGAHLFGPQSLPGFSAAEVDAKIQMRAVQWLLAGILAALVGLLTRR
jgi:hypothetical protein